MTESEWLACNDPQRMLEFLGQRPSRRKVRLFLLACCRYLWSSSGDHGTQVALDFADRFAEAHAVPFRANIIRIPEGRVVIDCNASDPRIALQTIPEGDLKSAHEPLADSPSLLAILERLACWTAPGSHPGEAIGRFVRAGLEPVQQAVLLRDIVRGPFRPLLFRAAWRNHDNGTSERLARVVYEDRAFELLPILADALEDAGCGNAEILAHCRGPGPHVRGCWVIDLLLGKS